MTVIVNFFKRKDVRAALFFLACITLGIAANAPAQPPPPPPPPMGSAGGGIAQALAVGAVAAFGAWRIWRKK